MAGNKVNTKAKGKDDRGKGSFKSIGTNNDEIEDTDFSLLRKPIQTSITGFAQARKIFDAATEELKGLLSEECDLLYECKVCRNLFRSLANFVSHKRVYCPNKFNSTVHGHFIKSSSAMNELSKIKRIEEGYQESLKEVIEPVDMDDDRIPMTKDLTAIIEKISTFKGLATTDEEPHFSLHKIPSSTAAVFQNVETEETEDDNMRSQVTELDDILSRNIAVLHRDGKFTVESSVPDIKTESQSEGVIQISDDEDDSNDYLKCKKCNIQFSTQKTFRFHMKNKHVDTRVVYPCPDCLEIFSTSWSVYRHLFKVHRKTAGQVRRLRESIVAKAFKMNNPPAFYEKRRNNMKTIQVQKITEEERRDQENQAWIDNMECDGEIPRCGGCGRTFERRAALAAHTHTCQPRSRALRRPDTKRIEIQIRKDYNKGPAAVPSPLAQQINTDLNDNKTIKIKDSKETKEDQDEEDQPKAKCKKEPDPEEVSEKNTTKERSLKEASPECAMQNGEDTPDSKSTSVSPEKVDDEAPETKPQDGKLLRLPFAQHAEKSNLMALRQRIIPDIELDTLRCKKCDTRCEHIQDLYDHVASHYNWMRYACKLCNFKHYNFEKLPEHVKVVHKLKGDKDFYFSTVKAMDGPEASELATSVDESTEVDDTSSNSRRPSRCSSDSSRLSDDSSSSSVRLEGARKRKMTHKIASKVIAKRRKSIKGNKDADDEWTDKDDSQTNVKAFEENSSDIDDSYDRVAKSRVGESVASRRPVRRKAKPKNEDFEYDLSNLLKMEAQGYRESQTVTTTAKSSQTKKKAQQDNLINYEMLNKECCGALVSLSRKAVEDAKAHMKTAATLYIQREKLPSNIFIRPMIPKGLTRGDKLSPKKEVIEEKSDSPSSNMETPKDKSIDIESNNDKNLKNDTINIKENVSTVANNNNSKSNTEQNIVVTSGDSSIMQQNKESNDSSINNSTEKLQPKSKSIPSVLPLKLRRQSIDVIKNNPIINKNITEFSKAGMKTKILVIKPINRNKDGVQTAVNASLKFQTIKLKETNKSEDKSADQVVYVKVPQVDCITRAVSENAKLLADNKVVSERILSTPDESTVPREAPQHTLDALKNINIHSDKNGDINIEQSDPKATESIKLSSYSKSTSNKDDTIVNCDNLKLNSECYKNDVSIEKPANICEKVDDELK